MLVLVQNPYSGVDWLLVALFRITGAYPAFMRPRRFKFFFISSRILIPSLAFGAYNDQVRLAASIRGQSVVIWDFEYASMLLLLFFSYDTFYSSGDGTGASVAQSKALYADVAGRRPLTILTINHETKGERKFKGSKSFELNPPNPKL